MTGIYGVVSIACLDNKQSPDRDKSGVSMFKTRKPEQNPMRTIIVQIVCALAAFLSGCGSIENAKGELGSGKSKVYSNSYDTIWDLAVNALPSLGISVVSADKSEKTITGSRGMSLSTQTYGERVALRVTSEGAERTRVEVVSKRVYAPNFLAENWEPIILQRIDDTLPGAPANAYTALQGGAKQAYSDFLLERYPRAFVIADSGKWEAVANFREKKDAVIDLALGRCKAAGYTNCKLYAVNADIVWRP